MSKDTFFDKIGVTDMERIHSAVIGWMLSDDCEAFDKSTRSQLLNNLFNDKTNRVYKTIISNIEWNDIDILIITEDENNNKDYWIIENKIKTSQHSNQLDKYQKIIEGNYPNAIQHYAFLTLIGEKALSSNEVWINITYDRLVTFLEENIKDKQKNTDTILLYEYYLSIKKMTDAAHAFILNPQNYQNVFTDGNKSKSAKENKSEDKLSNFISKNNLETIFQKMYFTTIIDEVLKNNPIEYDTWHVGETRGNADFAIHFKKYNDFDFDISFQAGSFKFAISRLYWKDCSKENIDSVLKWEEDFRELQKIYSNYNHFNKPRSRARISISMNIKKEKEKWYSMSKDAFVKTVKNEFDRAKDMMQKVIELHNKRSKSK